MLILLVVVVVPSAPAPADTSERARAGISWFYSLQLAGSAQVPEKLSDGGALVARLALQDRVPRLAHLGAQAVEVEPEQLTVPFAGLTRDEDGVDVACFGAEHDRPTGALSAMLLMSSACTRRRSACVPGVREPVMSSSPLVLAPCNVAKSSTSLVVIRW